MTLTSLITNNDTYVTVIPEALAAQMKEARRLVYQLKVLRQIELMHFRRNSNKFYIARGVRL